MVFDFMLKVRHRFTCTHNLETKQSTFEALIKDTTRSAKSHIVGETRRVGKKLCKLFMKVGEEFAGTTGSWSDARVLEHYSGLHESDYIMFIKNESSSPKKQKMSSEEDA